MIACGGEEGRAIAAALEIQRLWRGHRTRYVARARPYQEIRLFGHFTCWCWLQEKVQGGPEFCIRCSHITEGLCLHPVTQNQKELDYSRCFSAVSTYTGSGRGDERVSGLPSLVFETGGEKKEPCPSFF